VGSIRADPAGRRHALDEAKNLLRADGFTPCSDRSKNLMTTLCARR